MYTNVSIYVAIFDGCWRMALQITDMKIASSLHKPSAERTDEVCSYVYILYYNTSAS